MLGQAIHVSGSLEKTNYISSQEMSNLCLFVCLFEEKMKEKKLG